MVKTKRLVLEQLDPKKSTGMFDPQVFKGNNAIRIEMDTATTMWRFRMDKGMVPSALKNQYTGVNAALKHAAAYFASKSIIIKEVV